MMEVRLCQRQSRPSVASCFTTTSMFIRNLIPNREVSTQCSTNIDQRQKIELARLLLLEPWIRKRSIHVLSSQVSFLLRSVSGFESWLQYWTNDWWRGKHPENRKELIYLCTVFVFCKLSIEIEKPWSLKDGRNGGSDKVSLRSFISFRLNFKSKECMRARLVHNVHCAWI